MPSRSKSPPARLSLHRGIHTSPLLQGNLDCYLIHDLCSDFTWLRSSITSLLERSPQRPEANPFILQLASSIPRFPTAFPSERRWQSAGSHTLKNRDVVEVVDLTDSDQEGLTPERQAAGDGQPGAEGEGTWRDVEVLLRSI